MAQDTESAVIASMPAEAVRLGAAVHVFDPDGVVAMLINLSKNQRRCLAE